MCVKELIRSYRDAVGAPPEYSWSLLKQLIKEHHDPEYALDNGYYWVSPKGDYGSTKPDRIGGSHHSHLDRAEWTGHRKYDYWPGNGRDMVKVRTKAIALKILSTLILHNANCALERFAIEAR